MLKVPLNKKKLILIIIPLILIGIISAYIYASHSSPPPAIVEPGSMVTEADYIIFTDGINTYARNGKTGKIEFSGGDASNIINTAISQLANGGKIYISPGEYTISTSLLLNKQGVSLEGSFTSAKLVGTGDFPVIIVNGLGSTVKNFIIKGPGSDYGAGIQTNGWDVYLENLYIGSVKYGIHLTGSAPRTRLSHITIEPIGQFGLSNTYIAIYYEYPGTGAGWLAWWEDVDAGYCESDVIRIEKADSIWAINIRLIESGGNGLAIYGSTCYSNFANVQIDRMHGDALHLENMWETSFDGLWLSVNPSYTGRSLFIKNSRGIDITSVHMWSGEPVAYIENSYWITLNTGILLIENNEVKTNALVINNSNAVKLSNLVIDADRDAYKGIYYTGSPQIYPIKIIGCSVSNDFAEKINVSADPNAQIIASP